jgi:ADP-dependent NAD(P)H-hydrate dehydratase / NAD(P)H-hydrate epimerase
MKLATPEQMKAIDASAITEYGIPGIVLMENAASAVATEALSMLGGRKDAVVLLIAGSGNNGGDAFAAARRLHGRGVLTRVYLLGKKAAVAGDARINLDILEKTGIRVIEVSDAAVPESLRADMEKAQLIIDGIFGTGLSRDVDGLAGKVIELVNMSGKPVLSIDIPSGIDGRNGFVRGSCIHAAATVTFCLPKTGLVLHPGCEHTGRLVTADISIPACAVESRNITTELIDPACISKIMPARNANSNKGDFGRVLLVTGSTGMTGSGCLASMAALRSGAGLVYTGVPKSLAPIYSSALTEPIILPLEDNGSGILSVECAEQILGQMKRMSVAAIGPGLTASNGISEIVRRIIRGSTIPLVLDADALNVIGGNTDILKGLGIQVVLTPHPGEMARLTGLSIQDIQADRIGTAKTFAADHGVIVVLKGSRTIIALPNGQVYVNSTGNAGMATAGAGDTLTGIIAGLLAQGVDAGDAAAAGVFLHGLAGDAAADRLGMHGMVAGDIIDSLPQAIKSVTVYT